MLQKTGLLLLTFCILQKTFAQVEYPYPLHYFPIEVENKKWKMAFMDIAPSVPNGKTVILFHGKNFNGYYWKDFITSLVKKGYRVIVPDQIGWGRSDKPDIHYSFHMLAKNNFLLLDSLGIKKTIVIGHSMGGMLAARFALLYPDRVEKLILEDPIGLEDYKTFIPYQSLSDLFEKEKKATYESYKKYQQSYYPVWKDDYEQYVTAQAEALKDPDFNLIAWVNAITYQMIYEQPVVYELSNITTRTLIVVGLADKTVVGKDQLPEDQKNKYGQYDKLGKKINQLITGSKLVELENVGHIPHIQVPALFEKAVFEFL